MWHLRPADDPRDAHVKFEPPKLSFRELLVSRFAAGCEARTGLQVRGFWGHQGRFFAPDVA